MFTVRGTGRGSFISGKSVHNQRFVLIKYCQPQMFLTQMEGVAALFPLFKNKFKGYSFIKKFYSKMSLENSALSSRIYCLICVRCCFFFLAVFVVVFSFNFHYLPLKEENIGQVLQTPKSLQECALFFSYSRTFSSLFLPSMNVHSVLMVWLSSHVATDHQNPFGTF